MYKIRSDRRESRETLIKGGWGRERERGEGDRQTEADRQTETDRQTDRQRQRAREGQVIRNHNNFEASFFMYSLFHLKITFTS